MTTETLAKLGISRRADDMSHEGFLQVMCDPEGDYVVTVCDGRKTVSVEFVVHCPRSRNVLEALQNLKAAIDADNKDYPVDE